MSQSPRSLRTRRSDFLEGMREDDQDHDTSTDRDHDTSRDRDNDTSRDQDHDTSRDTIGDHQGEEEANQVYFAVILMSVPCTRGP